MEPEYYANLRQWIQRKLGRDLESNEQAELTPLLTAIFDAGEKNARGKLKMALDVML